MSRVICFGEIMLRLSPPGYQRFVQCESFDAYYAGGEANVSVSLANFGVDSGFVTKVPAGEIGQAAVNELRRYGVNTNAILRGGERLGIYFCEKGASQRPSKVIYDRKYSSICAALPSEFDWNKIFEGCEWFHFTGITPALSDNCAKAVLDAVKSAKALGISVSCDLNYRKNLWTPQKAGEVMGEIMPYVDLCIANEEDAEKVFGIKAPGADVSGGSLSKDGYKFVAESLAKKFGCKKIAITLRSSKSASENNWAAMLYDGGEFYFSKDYDVHIVDRVGGGDSFGGGLIYSFLTGADSAAALEFATAVSCLKHSVEGDFNHMSVAEVKALAGGDGSGRVQR